MNRSVVLFSLLALAASWMIGCAGDDAGKAQKLQNPECDSLVAVIQRHWAPAREYNELESPMYNTKNAFYEKFKGFYGNTCMEGKTQEEIAKLLGRPSFVMAAEENPQDTVQKPAFCYQVVVTDIKSHYMICALMNKEDKNLKQFVFANASGTVK